MNGVGMRKHSATASYDSESESAMAARPPAKALLNGYNPSQGLGNRETTGRGQNGYASGLLDTHDPVTMHLLMETAIGDCQQYAVLSVEEAEELKRELTRLDTRLESMRRQLTIDTKVRDAATNLKKLDKEGRQGASGRAGENSEEVAAAHERCEGLAQELWQLEKRHQDVQRQLLEHTAGILNMTHKGYLEKDAPQKNGLDAYAPSYGLDFSGAGDLDDQSFYRALDSALDLDGHGGGSGGFKKQTEAIQETERKLRDFNQRLREAIIQAAAGKSKMPGPPDPAPGQNEAEFALQEQFDYLENGFAQMQESQMNSVHSYQSSSQRLEEKLEDLNTQLHGITVRSSLDRNTQYLLPPEISGRGAEEQVSFLDKALETLEQNVFRLKEDHQDLSSRSDSHKVKATHYESMLQGLWPSMSEGEKFSEDAFSIKVSSLSTRVADLHNQKDILKRQIEQQRELNSKSDNQKDAKIAAMTAETEQAKQSADHAKAETNNVRQEMQDVESEIVRLQTELTVARAELDGAYGTRAQRAAEVAQHPALQQEIAELKQELDGARSKTGDNEQLQQQAQTLRKELSETITEYETMTKASIEFEKEREVLENAADSLRDRCEALETQLSEERVSKIGFQSPGRPGDRGSSEKGATSTSVLKNEFKKMMRETRAENMRALRHEQDERRKLEAQIRELKKGQAPGKSSLSQSMTAS